MRLLKARQSSFNKQEKVSTNVGAANTAGAGGGGDSDHSSSSSSEDSDDDDDKEEKKAKKKKKPPKKPAPQKRSSVSFSNIGLIGGGNSKYSRVIKSLENALSIVEKGMKCTANQVIKHTTFQLFQQIYFPGTSATTMLWLCVG